MVNYRRSRVAGGTFFFTVNLLDRRKGLLVDHLAALRRIVLDVKTDLPFVIEIKGARNALFSWLPLIPCRVAGDWFGGNLQGRGLDSLWRKRIRPRPLYFNQNQPLGNSRFYAKIETMTGQRREAKPRGRPRVEHDESAAHNAWQGKLGL